MFSQKNPDKKSIFLRILWLVMATSGFVIIEPAPIDLGIIVLFILGLLFSKIKIRKSISFIYFIFFLLILANMIPMFFVEDGIKAFKFFGTTIYLMISWLFFISLINVQGEKAIKVIFSGYTFAVVASALLGIYGYLSGSDLFLKYGRATGLFKDPNVFGPFMIPIVIYALIKIEFYKKYKIWWMFVFLVSTLAVLISYSRAAWGSYVLALIIYAGIRYWMAPNFKFLMRGLFITGVLVAVIMYVLTIPQIKQTMELRFAMQNYDTERFAKQGEALDVAINNPLGKGPGQTELVINYATHNSYLRIWLENGYLGLTCYILIILFSFFRSVKYALKTKNPIYALAAASIIAVVLNSFVVDVVHWRHFWLMLAIPWFIHPTLYRNDIKEDATNSQSRKSD